jgi:hypothetical protein
MPSREKLFFERGRPWRRVKRLHVACGMKALLVKTLLLVLTPLLVFAGEEVPFKAAENPKIGESSAFRLSKTDRAVLRITEGEYIVVQVLESIREESNGTFTEACTLAWTLISPKGIRGGTSKAYIRYKSEKTGENEFNLRTIGGSDHLEIGGQSIQWSYRSQSDVFLYPPVGTFFATTTVEPEHTTPDPR